MNYTNARTAGQSGPPARRPLNALLNSRNYRDPMRGLDSVPIQIFSRPTDESVSTAPSVEITNSCCIGSFNWVRRDIPTILVPGVPPRWREPQLPLRVPPDESMRIFDQRQNPGSELVPLLQAVNKYVELTQTSPFPWPSVDLVVDRGVLRKLLRWANFSKANTTLNSQFEQDGRPRAGYAWQPSPHGMRESDANFRVDLQLAGAKTVLMTRVPVKSTEDVQPGKSYRFTFQHAALEQLEGCPEYTRILSYDMNGIKMIVWFSADAYIDENNEFDQKFTSNDKVGNLGSATVTGNNKAERVEQSPQEISMNHGVEMRTGGRIIPDSSIVELTTRSVKIVRNDWAGLYCQMFLSQVSRHFTAKHDKGTYKIIKKRSTRNQKIKEAEDEGQVRLKKLFFVLDAIRQAVVDAGRHGRLSLVSVNGNLGIYQRNGGGDVAPEAILQAFEQ